MTETLPKVGAALTSRTLDEHLEWLIEGQRDLEIQDPCYPQVLDGDWMNLASEIRSRLDGYTGRLGIHGPFLNIAILCYDPLIREATQRRLLQGLEFGAEIGATHMVIHSPFLYFGQPDLMHSAESYPTLETEIGLVHETLAPVLDRAQQLGCMLVIENIADARTEPLIDLVRSFDTEMVRVSIDIGHALLIQHQRGGPTPDQWVRAAGPWLGHLHLQDGDGLADRHWMPSSGRLNWGALFTELSLLEHQPRMVLELRNHSEVLPGAQFLVEQGLVS